MRTFLGPLLALTLILTGCTNPAGDRGQTTGPARTDRGGGTPAPASIGDPNAKDAYAEAAADGDEIKIGVYLPMTGGQATFGEGTSTGMRLAADKINAGGGVLGKKLKLIVEDTQGKPDQAAQAASKLINQDNVLVVLGEVISSNSLAVAPICQQSSVPMISPSSTNPEVTRKGDFIFRVCFLDDFQGEVMARFAAEQLKLKKAALLVDQSSDYSKGLAEFFTAAFKARGGQVTTTEFYTQGDKDFTSVLNKIKSTSPEILVVPGYYTEVGLVANQARQQGLNVPLLGGDGWDSPKLTELGGKALEGSYYSTHYDVNAAEGPVAEFVTAFKAKSGGTNPDSLAALGYDAVMLMADAVNRAGKLNRWAIRDAIAATRDFPGITGKISINAERNADKSAVILQVKDGQLVYVTTIAPQTAAESPASVGGESPTPGESPSPAAAATPAEAAGTPTPAATP
ncbi:MAG: ABC transporter substrate-binding protein [Armatimonadetes bacterium]|nr:ABC transporter substrate-binding protein [Armatimonadota bacterium]